MPRRRCAHPAWIRSTTATLIADGRLHVRALLLVAVGAGTTPAHAQWNAGAELGGAHVAQPDLRGRVAGTAEVSVGFDSPGVMLRGSTAWTLPQSEQARVHAVIVGGAHRGVTRRLGLEVSGSGSVYDEGVFPEAMSAYAATRARARVGQLLVRAGVGIGALDDGVNAYPLVTLDAAGATIWGDARLVASATWHETQGEPRIELVGTPAPVATTVRDRLSYTDALLTAFVPRGQLELDVRGGARLVHETIPLERHRGPRMFGSVDAALWITPRAAFGVSAGRALSDLARGLPEARYASVSLRVRWKDVPRAASTRRRPHRPMVRGAAPDVLVERHAAGGAMLRVLAGRSTRRLEVAGTFTAWEPVVLTREGEGLWMLPTLLPSGPHRLMVRVDGGAWQPPANLPSLDDELGGRVGIITVP